MPNKIILYAHPAFAPSRAAKWILDTLGVEYEFKLTTPRKDTDVKEFLLLFPFGTVPALQVIDEEENTLLAISELSAIADYVCNISGEKGEALYPKDPIIRAKVLQMVLHGQVSMRQVSISVVRPLNQAFFSKSPCPYNKDHIGNFMKNDFEGKVVDMSRAAGWTKAKHDGSRDEVVENPTTVFLVPEAGNKPTVADFVNYAETYQLESLEVPQLQEIFERRPAFKRWHDAMKALPGWEKAHHAVHEFHKNMLIPLLPK